MTSANSASIFTQIVYLSRITVKYWKTVLKKVQNKMCLRQKKCTFKTIPTMQNTYLGDRTNCAECKYRNGRKNQLSQLYIMLNAGSPSSMKVHSRSVQTAGSDSGSVTETK